MAVKMLDSLVFVVLLLGVASCTMQDELPQQDAPAPTTYIDRRLAVAMLHCDDLGPHRYTHNNTEVYDLQASDEVRLAFVVVSELECGYSMGSCGYSIYIYQADDTGQYTIVYEDCAAAATRLIEVNSGYSVLELERRTGYTERVIYRDGAFTVMPIAYYDLPIEQARAMADTLDASVETLFGPLSTYRRSHYAFEDGTRMVAYTLTTDDAYTFLFKENRLVFYLNGLRELEWVGEPVLYERLRIEQADSLVVTDSTMVYMSWYYEYSVDSGCYILSD